MRVRVKVGLRLMLNARVEVRGESKNQRLGYICMCGSHIGSLFCFLYILCFNRYFIVTALLR